ncbi:MAG: DNRLRE domain-containing protein [Planctomycetota bacterium]|jgi:hypothetical protein
MSKKFSFLLAFVVALGMAPIGLTNAATPPSVPNWTLQVVSWPLEKAYPGIEYNIRLGVIGGRYPYSFSQEVYQDFTVDVTTNGFYFVATNGNDSTGDGSITNPWKTMSYAIAQGTTSDILYVRGGTYVGTITASSGDINKWIAYPGELPIIDVNRENYIRVRDSYALIDGFEIKNSTTKGLFVEAGHLIARRNHMHHLYDETVRGNPSFIFFPTGGWWDYNVIQDNTFHDLFDPDNMHGGGVIYYDVRYSLYEDNEAYNIDGNGFHDKDRGYHNTVRGNILHGANMGVMLLNHPEQIDICYNLVYDTIEGIQPGGMTYARDIYVHHNTVVSNIKLRNVIALSGSDEIHIYNNIITNGNSYLYACEPDAEAAVLADDKVHVDDNLLWTTGSYVFGHTWGTTMLTFSQWQGYGKDLDGIFVNSQLDANYNLPSNSPYLGTYGRQIVTGSQPPDQAGNPSPPDSAADVAVTADLSWTAGSGATSHDVYFGTDSTPDSGEDQGNQTVTTFDAGTMANSTTYYWRIDEINANGTTTGDVWSFTTTSGASPPGQASSPSPANSATSVSTTADLNWTAGSGSTSSDVYFGTDSTPDSGELQGNQTATTFDPGTLNNVTTYYWRIDEVNSAGTTTGTLWSFTTAAASSGETIKINFQPSASSVPSGYEVDSGASYGSRGNGLSYGWETTNSNTRDRGIDSDQRYDTLNHFYTNTWEIGLDSGTYDVWVVFGDPGYADTTNTMDIEGTTCTDPDGEDSFDEYNIQVDVNDGRLTIDLATGADNPKICFIEITPASVEAPGAATNPSPANSATDVAIDADLSWTADANATSHDVYFGTSSPGASQGNQTATTFDTGTMTNNTTYYWRIDEINSGGTTTGTVWSFTTVVTAPGQATNPGPANSATGVSITADLSWTAGSGSTSRDVYFGTDSTPDSGELQGNQTATTFDPGTMTNNTTYYWRIDEVNAGGTTLGTVWSFTTIVAPPGAASIPSPAGSATDVSITADLSWTAGSGATSRDVYFGTSSPGTSQGNQTATTFDTGTMSNNTTYYWRIDEVNAAGTTTGTVWSFTTIAAASVPGQATSPNPANSATEVSITADLSWTAGTDSTSSDVYFGTDSSPDSGEDQGNQTATTFEPGTLNNDTTYYWRIDEINAQGTTTGSVWSFTTVASGGQVTEEFGDAADSNYPGTIGDTYTNVGSDGDDNLSTDTTLNTYTWPADTIANTTIIKWDLTDISTDANVISATLYLYQTDSGGDSSYDIGVHKITGVDPGITTCTWNTYDGTNSWTGGADGGQSDIAAAEDTPSVNLTDDEYKTWDVTDMVADWVSAPASNYGMLLNSDNDASIDSHRFFASTDANDASTRPKLIVTYSASSPPGQATNPNPGIGATDSINADLSWTAGSGATSHDVYFGTSSPGTSQGNQTATTFDTGTLDNDTTYYWRIDEVNAEGTTTGNLWNFTTIVAAPGQASNPGPANAATDVSITTDLSWTAGSGSTSSDVYFGTSNPGAFQGNQTATTYDPGTLANGTTYYWRINEVNAATTTTGTVWSFTTEAAGGSLTKEFGDAVNTDYPGTIEDTFVDSGTGNDNKSTHITLNTYTWPADTVANTTIIKWDLTDIPTYATVTQATLYLYQTDSGGDSSYDVGVHKIINVNPVIATCTWNTYDGTNSWTGGTDGGQGDTANVEDTPDVNATNSQYKTWSVTNMVADWVSTPSSNYGMLVNSDDVAAVDSHRFFASSDANDSATRPKLIVTYSGSAPSQASNPSPANTATDVNTTTDLSWTEGSGSTSSDVYFGTTSPGTSQGNQTATTFDTGTMDANTTYYWRIDEINAAGTTTGTVWNFTTAAAGETIKINFQPSASAVPTGYEVDSGATYGSRGNGLSYGWDTTNGETRDRGADSDQRYDTLNHVNAKTWEIGLDNGTYDIWLVCGDPAYADSTNTLDIEGTTVTDPDGQDYFDEYNIQVSVNDGKLTIASATGAYPKLCFIEITP